MNYNENVSVFRDLARDEIRLQMTNRRRDAILNLDKDISLSEKDLENLNKRIARNDYKLSKLEEANPDFEELKKSYEDDNTELKKVVETVNKEIEETKKKKNELLDEITKIQAGDIKVNAEELTEKTKVLIDAHVKGLAEKAEVKE
jgi:chromosome segregation ATPase